MDTEQTVQSLEEQKRGVLKASVAVALIFFILIIVAFLRLFAGSLGWFTQNKTVTANGMSIVLEAPEIGTYMFDPEQGYIPIDGIISSTSGTGITIPGTSIEFDIVLRNESQNDGRTVVVKQFGFEKPEVLLSYTEYPDADTAEEYDEIPAYSGTTPCFFGTVLKAKLTSVETAPITETEGIPNWTTAVWTTQWPTAETDLTAGLGKVILDDPELPTRVKLFDAENPVQANQTYITLNDGDAIRFHIVVTFENFDTAQDVYQQFGSVANSGKCSRMIYIEFDEPDETTE